jgi:hypothetical protein
MQIEAPTVEVISNMDNLKSYKVGFDDSSDMIAEGLSKMLYPDPIRAICREISINARDSHVEAGCPDIPIEIYLPGDYFIVKDYGPGMSPERINEVYRWLGRSNKRSDNRQVGGFGIGSKTPWAVSEQFLIITIVEGIKYTYNAAINKEKLTREVILISQQETNEPNGTTIKVPIKFLDRQLYKGAVLATTAFWPVKPKIYNQYGAEVPDLGYRPAIEDKNWSVYTGTTGGVNVLVGYVPYQDYQFSIPNKVILKMPVGSVDLSLSRDSLRYTQKTNDAIKAALAAYYADIFDKAQADISTVEKFNEVVTIIDSLPKPQAGVFEKDWIWKGFKFKYPLTDPIHIYELRL